MPIWKTPAADSLPSYGRVLASTESLLLPWQSWLAPVPDRPDMRTRAFERRPVTPSDRSRPGRRRARRRRTHRPRFEPGPDASPPTYRRLDTWTPAGRFSQRRHPGRNPRHGYERGLDPG